MRIEWLHGLPGQRIGYHFAEDVDQRSIDELGIDVAVFGAIDRVRAVTGDRPRLRLVFDSADELSKTALFVYELAVKPVMVAPMNHAMLMEFFNVHEVTLTLAISK